MTSNPSPSIKRSSLETNYPRRLRSRIRTTTATITKVPGHRNQPRPLLYPPATMQPEDTSSIDTASPNPSCFKAPS